MFKGKLTLKIFLLLVSSDLLETLTQYCFKKGAIGGLTFDVNSFSGALVFLGQVALSPYLWLGIISVGLTFIIWSTALSRVDLSVAVPVASFSYIFIPVISIIFLHERVSVLRWLGIFLILAGVIFVSASTKEKENR